MEKRVFQIYYRRDLRFRGPAQGQFPNSLLILFFQQDYVIANLNQRDGCPCSLAPAGSTTELAKVPFVCLDSTFETLPCMAREAFVVHKEHAHRA